jgi:tetratricopeptide (TPR) repeat protein
MLNTLFDGHLKESVTYGEQALEIARSLNNTEQLAFILNDLVRVYHSNGMSEKGHVANLEARALWQKLGNLPMLVDNMATASEYMFFNGEYERAIVMAQEAYEIGQSIQNIWGQTFCLMMLGFTYIELGELEKAIEANQTLLSFDPRQTFKIAQLSSRAQLADIYKEVGDLKMAYQYGLAAIDEAKDLEPALQVAVQAGLASYELLHGNLFEAEMVMESLSELYDPENFTTFVPQYVESTRNDLLMYKGEFVAALEALDTILSIMERLQIVFCRDDFMLRKANALAALERKDEALQVLQEAAVGAESIHARRVLWKIYARMNELQTELGHTAAAKVSSSKAREHIAFLCDRLPESLRRSFVRLPAVEKLLQN